MDWIYPFTQDGVCGIYKGLGFGIPEPKNSVVLVVSIAFWVEG